MVLAKRQPSLFGHNQCLHVLFLFYVLRRRVSRLLEVKDTENADASFHFHFRWRMLPMYCTPDDIHTHIYTYNVHIYTCITYYCICVWPNRPYAFLPSVAILLSHLHECLRSSFRCDGGRFYLSVDFYILSSLPICDRRAREREAEKSRIQIRSEKIKQKRA